MQITWNDLNATPDTGENADTVLARSYEISDTPGEEYLQQRNIPSGVALEAQVRYTPNFNGRPAVLAPLRNDQGQLMAVHGRYIQHIGKQTRMLTIGYPSGVFTVLKGLESDPLILVEGLFDALSLAACGVPCIATIGRWIEWLPGFHPHHTIILAFDGNKSGDAAADYFTKQANKIKLLRLRPPGRCKDWNTTLNKIGVRSLTRWLSENIIKG